MATRELLKFPASSDTCMTNNQTINESLGNISLLTINSPSTATAHQLIVTETNRSFWSTTNDLSVALGFFGIVTNTFACFVIVCHTPLLKRLPNYFIINQCILDLVSGFLLILTIAVTYALTPVVTNNTLLYLICAMFNTRFLFTGTFTASIWNLTAMSLERYVEIVHPIRHKLYMTRAKVFNTCMENLIAVMK
jgi:7 transmembrane receptor (rhodopsin family)